MTLITAARVITPRGVLSPGAVEIDGGLIVVVEPGPENAPDVTLVPGFVDLQVNGIGPVDVAGADGDDWDELDRRLLAQGVTAWCPTLVTAPLESYAAPLQRIAAASERGGLRPAILGAHLEGPFLGGAPGAHRRHLIRPFDRAWLAALPPIVRLITLAPELDGAVDVIASLRERDITVALGHSTASYEQAEAATAGGATLVTHCFNGMGPLHHREPGLLGAALTDDRLAASVIADLVHAHPAALALAFRAKGAGRIAVVTDAVAWQAPDLIELGVRFDGRAPTLPDGTIAGSAVTMDASIANLVHHAGVSLPDAVRAASTTPADVMGADDRGRIAPACRADLVALDRELRIVGVWIAGEQIHA
ncbi:MAG: N-acetylgalactosamine-6-phosphate deacetylase [Actinomycetota bacterium]